MIPEQLHSDIPTFLRLGYKSKAPKKGNSASEGPFFHYNDSEMIQHLVGDGNIGRVLRDDLIAFDIDSDELKKLLDERLPTTFEIESGGEGTGFHRYYRCSEYSGNQLEFKHGNRELGGLRSGNSYCLIPPSKHDQTGNEYQVSEDREIASLNVETVEEFVSELRERTSQHNPAAAAAAAAGVGGSEIPEIPSEYPQKSVNWRTIKKWLKSNRLLSQLDKTTSTDWSGFEFKIAKCLAEGGFSEESIKEALDRLNHNSKWHRRGNSYQQRTVRKAIVAACDDEFVNFHTDDMGAREASESRKTESGSEGTRQEGGENMPEFNERESVKVKEGSSDGDRAIEAVRVEGVDGSDTFEFVSIRKGRVRTVELTNGDEGQMIDIDQTNGKSVGGTADLDLVIEALEELREEIN